MMKFVYVLAGLPMLLGMPAGGQAQERAPVKIGLGLPLSGGVAFMGNRYLRGWEVAVSEINAAGGIQGRPLELVVRDQRSSPSEAVAVAKRLIELDKVSAFDITQPGSATLATKATALETKTPMISGITYLPSAVDKDNPFFFRVGGNNDLLVETGAQFLRQSGKKRLAVLAINEDYGRGMVDTIKRAAASGGYEVVFADFYDRAQTDFSAILLRMRAAKPDSYFIDVRYPQSVTAIKQMAELGMKEMKLGTSQLFNPELTQRVGKALDDTYVVIGWAAVVPGAASNMFQQAYRKKFQDEPDDFAADGWAVAHIMADAFKRAGPDATGETLRKAIADTRIDSVKGPVRFNDANDAPIPMRVLRYNDGKWSVFPLKP